jgi:hypothetical protein
MPVPHSITSAALAGSAGARSGRTGSIIETDKATGDKDPCGRDGSCADVAACRRQGGIGQELAPRARRSLTLRRPAMAVKSMASPSA